MNKNREIRAASINRSTVPGGETSINRNTAPGVTLMREDRLVSESDEEEVFRPFRAYSTSSTTMALRTRPIEKAGLPSTSISE